MEILEYHILLWYVIGINTGAISIYGWDKFCAIHRRWRIPEKILLLIAVSGGSAGALMAMLLFRHKTRHKKFRYGVPFILILQIAGSLYWYPLQFNLSEILYF